MRFVLETHVHNDYVSWTQEVRVATGAEVRAQIPVGLVAHDGVPEWLARSA